MLLGTIMEQLRDEAAAATTLLSLGDIVLVAEVEDARVRYDESIGQYVAGAAQRFARSASDEDWLRLMTALERSDRPAGTCLATMVRWAVAQDAIAATNIEAGGGCSCAGANGGRCHGEDR